MERMDLHTRGTNQFRTVDVFERSWKGSWDMGILLSKVLTANLMPVRLQEDMKIATALSR